MSVDVLLPLLAVIVIFYTVYAIVNLPGKLLSQKFRAMGDMHGMTRKEVVARLGKYKSVRKISGGYLCTWSAIGFSCCIAFDSDHRVVKSACKSNEGSRSHQLKPVLAE